MMKFPGHFASVSGLHGRLLGSGVFLIAATAMAQAETKIGIVVETLSNPYFSCLKKAADEEAAKHSDVSLTVVGGASGSDIAGNVKLIEDMMQKKVDVLSFIASDPDVMMNEVKKVQTAGIPVLIHSDDTRQPVAKHYIGPDQIGGEGAVARMLAEALDGKGEVAIIEGQPGNISSEARKHAAMDVLAKYPDIKVVGVWNGGWDRSLGMKVTQDILTAHPNLAGVAAVNDDMALGALQAIRAAGRGGKVFITGFNGTHEAIETVGKGQMLGTVLTYCDGVGRQIIRTALDVVNKRDPDIYRIDTGTVPIDTKLVQTITGAPQK
jgi:ribose transport system substrate-binding protein